MGTLVNAIAVVAGSLIGLLIRRGLPERVEGAAMKLLGLSVLIIGFNGVVTSMVTVGADGSLSSDGSLLLIASLVIGGVSGELWEIDDKLTRMGKRIEERFGKEGFAKGFINGSLIYCIGAMAIIGALNDGLTGDSSIRGQTIPTSGILREMAEQNGYVRELSFRYVIRDRYLHLPRGGRGGIIHYDDVLVLRKL